MKVAVLKETAPDERRVALVPPGVKALVASGLDVCVQAGAGAGSHIPDEDYRAAGATIAADAAEALRDAGLVLCVAPPPSDGAALRAPRGTILIGFISPLTNLDLVRRLADAGITAISMELIPRITRAQSMDALSSQATVAGYKAVIVAADHLPKLMPMFTTAAGTIRPAKALVLGAGVAGLQAIATCRRLGAVVEAFDVRPAVKEQVQSLGAKFLEAAAEVAAEGEGGYAKELSDEQHERELELIAKHVISADIVITTAQIPGRPAPLLLTEAMVRSMSPGSVIVDLASESGGNCALTRHGETVRAHGVTILGPVNLPASIPIHASQMYSKNVVTLVGELLADGGELRLDFENDVVGPATVTHGGEVRNDRVREALTQGATA